jgi:hypothetical protein
MMEFKQIKDKAKYLKKNYPFDGVPKLTEIKHCIHCGQNFLVGDYKVHLEYNYLAKKKIEYIVCPYAPDCSGSVIDWFSVEEEDIDIE